MYRILLIISRNNSNIKYDNKFLWEYAVENIPSDCIVVSALKDETDFWQKYIIENKPSKPFSVFFEKPSPPNKLHIFSNLPKIFTAFKYKNPSYIIMPIVYCEDFSFAEKMWEKENCIAIKRMDCEETDYFAEIGWSGKIKKISSGKRGYSWKITGIMKTTEETVKRLLETNRMISSIQEAIAFMFNNLGVKFDYVKIRGRISYDGKFEETSFPLHWLLMDKELKKFEYSQGLYNSISRGMVV